MIKVCFAKAITNKFKLKNMCDFLGQVEGNVVEVGVYKGGSLSYMAIRNPFKTFYGYDTFEGMPKPCSKDNFHKQKDFLTNFEFVKSKLVSII
jgi:tRNA G46 methylase TrmB